MHNDADDWIFEGNLTSRYKQIGNAVPVRFGERIGRHLLTFDAGEALEVQHPEMRLSRYKNTDHRSWLAAQSPDWVTGKLF